MVMSKRLRARFFPLRYIQMSNAAKAQFLCGSRDIIPPDLLSHVFKCSAIFKSSIDRETFSFKIYNQVFPRKSFHICPLNYQIIVGRSAPNLSLNLWQKMRKNQGLTFAFLRQKIYLILTFRSRLYPLNLELVKLINLFLTFQLLFCILKFCGNTYTKSILNTLNRVY